MKELFDQAFVNELPEPLPWENPWVIWLCKFDHAKRHRAAVEQWYGNLPDAVKPHFYERLRSLDNSQHIPAYYELVAHQYCTEEGWAVDYEPVMGNGYTPDFVVTTKSGYKFVLEIASLFDSKEFARLLANQRDLDRRLSALKTDLVLTLHHQKLPEVTVTPKKIVGEVSKWLDTLPKTKKSHKKRFTNGGYDIEVEAETSDEKPGSGSVLAIFSPTISVPEYSGRITNVLDGKKRKYSSTKTGLPLVVMVAAGTGGINIDEHAIDKALFGQHVLVWHTDTSKPARFERDGAGYFTPTYRGDVLEGKNTGVSAVIYAAQRDSESKHGLSFQMQVLHNPAPHILLDEGTFEKMPQLVKTNIDPTKLTLRWVINDPVHQRIHFLVELPGEDSDFSLM